MRTIHALALLILVAPAGAAPRLTSPSGQYARLYTGTNANTPNGHRDITATFPAPPDVGGNVTFTAPGAFAVE